MSGTLLQAWQAVVDHPLFWVGMTLAAYQLGVALYQRTKLAVFHPVLVSTAVLVLVILAVGQDYAHYREAVQPLQVLLGPATVALAVPLYMNFRRIRSYFWPVLVCLLVGGTLATVLAVLLAWLLAQETLHIAIGDRDALTDLALLYLTHQHFTAYVFAHVGQSNAVGFYRIGKLIQRHVVGFGNAA